MKKTEMITTIINLYDELEQLKNNRPNVEIPQDDELQKKLMELAIEYLYEKTTNSWSREKYLRIWYNEDNEIMSTTFEKWVNETIIKKEIPEFLSYEQYLKIMTPLLKEKYDEIHEQKLKEFKKENE